MSGLLDQAICLIDQEICLIDPVICLIDGKSCLSYQVTGCISIAAGIDHSGAGCRPLLRLVAD